MRIDLSPASWLDYRAGWLAADEADAVAERLRAELAWEERAIVLFGKRVLQPRLVAWAGALPYRYSGQTLEPRAMPAALAGLIARVEAASDARFDHALVNRYRDGHDSMGMHADDEPELGPDPIVAAVSLGATRRLAIVPKRPNTGARRVVDLEHGSLLVMGGAMQHEFRHGVPKQPEVGDERINVTLRLLLRPPV